MPRSLAALFVLGGLPLAAPAADPLAGKKPNVVFVLADDLAQGDLGSYGQKLIKTPNLDRMAKEGTRFTQAYCGTSVCAPSRTSLMIGRHTGHSPIRANREVQPEGQKPLPPGTYTVARLFQDNGYATACVGKWGMGMFDTPGSPLKVGFDHFFGYNCQRHAHSYFPTYLYRDDKRFDLPGNDGKGVGKTYAQNLIADETLAWVTANKDRPFFLYYAVTLPHGRHEIDDQGVYKTEPWTEQQKNYAAMVTRLDADVGRLLAKLKELNLDDKTLVIVAGDNGSSFAPTSEIGKRFDQTTGGTLRGFKRSLYEGGLRQACLARWPGVVPVGRVSDDPWAFWDFLPTCADLIAAKLPPEAKTDGVSVLPLLKGGPVPKRDYFYWELHESGPSLQAVRFGDWKAVKNGPAAAVELYDLNADPGEKADVAAKHPDLVAKAVQLMAAARTDHPDWPLRDRPQPKAIPNQAETEARAKLSRSLTLHASFDKGLDADFSRGDKTCYVQRGKELVSAKPNEEVKVAADAGRYGGALYFPRKGTTRPSFKDGGVLGYNARSWSATVSAWLRLDPDKDLQPGYCDPIQIIGDDNKKGYIFLEWSKDETPRYFRYAIRPLFHIWNPTNVPWGDIPFEKRPMVQVVRAPFSREKWTHVVFTLENINDKTKPPVGRLYLNGKLQGAIENWDLTFDWDPARVLLVLGASYVGHLDDLAVFDRPLTDVEVDRIYGLRSGVRELYP